ncbi:MAG: HEAT repeat domain-containing protein [Spirochaetes bacterium]|nr:HEAT repeat domain-containing protein [Spirochaetota bacterium]MBU0956149.1 HEAT repeat domain-containing protein [Spirochaetota bacterium]
MHSAKTRLTFLLLALIMSLSLVAQGTGSERTVEEAYLQQSLEGMIIREQAYAESKDMKLIALQYIRQAVDEGRATQEIQQALEFLSTEGILDMTRSAGLGRPLNNYPDVRREAALILGDFKTKEAKDTLVKLALADNEPMVIAAALRSLGKIGMIENDDVTQVISFIVSRWDVLMPDNILAFESLVALEALADQNNGLEDPAAVRAILRIAEGNYITPVKQKARELLNKLRTMTANNAGK